MFFIKKDLPFCEIYFLNVRDSSYVVVCSNANLVIALIHMSVNLSYINVSEIGTVKCL